MNCLFSRLNSGDLPFSVQIGLIGPEDFCSLYGSGRGAPWDNWSGGVLRGQEKRERRPEIPLYEPWQWNRVKVVIF